jgi:PAS domain S-box-containing protein
MRVSTWSPEYLAAIVESSDDAIIGKTLDGTIVSWNPGAERIYGYTSEEVVGRPITIIMPPELPDEFPSIMSRLRRGERVDHYQTIRVRKDGKRLDMSVTISPVRDASGVIIGASAIARDITAQIEAAKEVIRLRDEFISVAAHELRSPLTTVYARLQLAERRLAREGADLELVRRDVTRVREAADRLRVLIDRLLDVSRIRAGKLDLDVAPSDVGALVRSIATTFGESAGREVVLRIPSSGPVGELDSVRFEEVLTNLLDNAAKYARTGPIEVEVFARDTTITVAVTDHGPGIAASERDRIFEPFHRSGRDGSGVGLGLHVAREIVELHGGTLTLELPATGGSRFVVCIPKEIAKAKRE